MQTALSLEQMEHRQWLQQRKKGIGGTDIPGILGISKYKSPIQVYMDKMGELPDQDLYEVDEDGAFLGGNEAAYWGNKDEDTIAKEFSLRTKMKVRRKNEMFVHPDYPHFFANVDRVIVGKKEGLECKTTSAFLHGEWKDEVIPNQYFLQVQWYLGVTGYERWWIAVRIGGNHFIHKVIERDEELIAMLFEQADHFWKNHILADNPPLMDGSEASTKLLDQMYPDSNQEQAVLPNSILEKLERIDTIKEQTKELENEEEKLKNQIKDELGENEEGTFEYSPRTVKWKTESYTHFDKKQLAKDYPDLIEKYTEKRTKRPFKI